jgi:hypothetical protein
MKKRLRNFPNLFFLMYKEFINIPYSARNLLYCFLLLLNL